MRGDRTGTDGARCPNLDHGLEQVWLQVEYNHVLILVVLYMLAFLMVSKIKYNSFKKPELFKKMNFNVLVTAILILIFIAAQPSIALFIIGITYVLSGPVNMVWQHIKPKHEKAEKPKVDRPGTTT